MMLKKILFTIIIFTTTQVQAREIILAEKGYVDDLATKRVRPSEMAAAITAALTSYTTKTYVDNLVSSIATLTTAEKLNTARTVQTNLASTTAASFNGTANITPGVTGVLPVANGGTGSSTKNFVDLSSAQTIAGVKTFSSMPSLPGVLPITNGGTGSSTKNFVDLSNAQTVGGVKTFSSMPVVPSVSAVTAYASASATKPVTETQLRTGGVAMTDIKYTLSTSAINPDNTNIMYKNGVVYISINSLTIGPWNMSGGSVYIGNIAAGYRPALTVFSIATVYLSTGAYVGDCVIQTDGNITVYRGNMPESVPNSVRFFAQFAYPVN